MILFAQKNGYEVLMEQLCARLDVNIQLALRSGVLPPRTARRMVSHCAACGESDTCHAILKNPVSRAPSFCLNSKTLLILKSGQREGPHPTKKYPQTYDRIETNQLNLDSVQRTSYRA